MNKKIIWGFVALCFLACNPTAKKNEATISTTAYFSIKDYFASEIKRLQKSSPQVVKSVTANNKIEQKIAKNINWETELAIFANADINKKSWLGEFKEVKHENNLLYTTSNPNIPIKRLEVARNEQQNILSIKIYRKANNYLYQSTDTLLYFPNKLYEVKSQQKITLMSEKHYRILGIFSEP